MTHYFISKAIVKAYIYPSIQSHFEDKPIRLVFQVHVCPANIKLLDSIEANLPPTPLLPGLTTYLAFTNPLSN